MDFQTIRIYGSVAIILGCFIFLYPKLLHPMFSTLLGLNSNSQDEKSDDSIPKHPDMGGGHPGGGDLPENIRKMRHGPHPGMRATAAEQAKQAKGSGRGMMGIILPMYAVGIVVYLIYTLFKVFGKNDKGENNRGSPSREPEVAAYDIGQKGEEQEEMDMRQLQERLAETEARMSQILTAMQSVQSKVGEDEAPLAKTVAPPEESVAPPAQPAQTQKEEPSAEEGEKTKEAVNVSDRSSESSPESESYEIVSKSDRESSGEEGTPKSVETLTSTIEEELQPEVEDEDDEVREEILKDKEDCDDGVPKSVRKRIPKMEAES